MDFTVNHAFLLAWARRVVQYITVIIVFKSCYFSPSAQPDHDPDTKHCLCGADGNLSLYFMIFTTHIYRLSGELEKQLLTQRVIL